MNIQMKRLFYISKNSFISENGYFTINQICNLLRKYKNDPEKIQFIADMLEE